MVSHQMFWPPRALGSYKCPWAPAVEIAHANSTARTMVANNSRCWQNVDWPKKLDIIRTQWRAEFYRYVCCKHVGTKKRQFKTCDKMYANCLARRIRQKYVEMLTGCCSVSRLFATELPTSTLCNRTTNMQIKKMALIHSSPSSWVKLPWSSPPSLHKFHSPPLLWLPRLEAWLEQRKVFPALLQSQLPEKGNPHHSACRWCCGSCATLALLKPTELEWCSKLPVLFGVFFSCWFFSDWGFLLGVRSLDEWLRQLEHLWTSET